MLLIQIINCIFIAASVCTAIQSVWRKKIEKYISKIYGTLNLKTFYTFDRILVSRYTGLIIPSNSTNNSISFMPLCT